MSSPSGPHRRPALLWAVLVVVTIALALAGVVLAADPADGQAAPAFACDGSLYVVTGTPIGAERYNGCRAILSPC